MCAVNAGGCVICLSRAGLPQALYYAWSQATTRTQTIRPSPPVPFVYPCIWLVGWQAGDEKSPQILSFFPTNRPDRESNRVGSVIGQSVTTRTRLTTLRTRYLHDIFTIDNPAFEKPIPDIHVYPTELQLNKANTSDKETSFLDLKLVLCDKNNLQIN